MSNYDPLGFFVGMLPLVIYMWVRHYRLRKRLDDIIARLEGRPTIEDIRRLKKLEVALSRDKIETDNAHKKSTEFDKTAWKAYVGIIATALILPTLAFADAGEWARCGIKPPPPVKCIHCQAICICAKDKCEWNWVKK